MLHEMEARLEEEEEHSNAVQQEKRSMEEQLQVRRCRRKCGMMSLMK